MLDGSQEPDAIGQSPATIPPPERWFSAEATYGLAQSNVVASTDPASPDVMEELPERVSLVGVLLEKKQLDADGM